MKLELKVPKRVSGNYVDENGERVDSYNKVHGSNTLIDGDTMGIPARMVEYVDRKVPYPSTELYKRVTITIDNDDYIIVSVVDRDNNVTYYNAVESTIDLDLQELTEEQIEDMKLKSVMDQKIREVLSNNIQDEALVNYLRKRLIYRLTGSE